MLGTDGKGKWLVYQGSVYSAHKQIPNEFYVMSEQEWGQRVRRHETGRAEVLQRGLTHDVARKMCNLAKEGT